MRRISFVLAAVVLLLALGWFLYSGAAPFGGDPAYCMCSCSLMPPSDPTERQAYCDRIKSQDFILTILKRDPKYAPLVSEAVNFWNPKINDGHLENNHIPTNFDRSFQPLFLSLRDDIYTELDYLSGLAIVKKGDPENLSTGFALLDAVKKRNPLIDVDGRLKELYEEANSQETKDVVLVALQASEMNESMESAYYAHYKRLHADSATPVAPQTR
jgi:hypothetical protein